MIHVESISKALCDKLRESAFKKRINTRRSGLEATVELMRAEPIDYGKYPVRTCRSLHHCEICGKDITHGNSYHDGRPGKRAHVLCEKERRFNEYNANPHVEETCTYPSPESRC